ncbi:MAG: divergent polysaccharide deacetylase family protein, partial [Desulfosalsimonas sp.]
MAETENSKRKTGKKSGSAKKTAPVKKGASASKSKTGKKTASGKSKAGSSARRTRKKARGAGWEVFLFAGILAAVVLAAGYYHLYFKPSQRPAKPVSVPERPEPVPPEIAEREDSRPMVAIVIDDLGHEKGVAEKLAALEGPFTFAILPGSTFQREIAEIVHSRGGEVMLHQPMEPRSYPDKDPGPGALLSEMSPDERISILKEHLDALPHVRGVNNHMGSKMSEESAHMNQI